jgi:hypothetical protein
MSTSNEEIIAAIKANQANTVLQAGRARLNEERAFFANPLDDPFFSSTLSPDEEEFLAEETSVTTGVNGNTIAPAQAVDTPVVNVFSPNEEIVAGAAAFTLPSETLNLSDPVIAANANEEVLEAQSVVEFAARAAAAAEAAASREGVNTNVELTEDDGAGGRRARATTVNSAFGTGTRTTGTFDIGDRKSVV